jgi:5'-nucleotidase
MHFLHTSDFHGRSRDGFADKLRIYRKGLSTPHFYVDCGDGLATGNLSIPMRAPAHWDLLNSLDCDVATLGNRETHPSGAAFERKLEGCRTPLVVANISPDTAGSVRFHRSLILEKESVRVGFFGVMVPMAKRGTAAGALWSHHFSDPMAVALEVVSELRDQVDILVCLSHVGYSFDIGLANKNVGVDVILGGHTHKLTPEPEHHANTWVAHSGCFGKGFGHWIWSGGKLTGHFVEI